MAAMPNSDKELEMEYRTIENAPRFEINELGQIRNKETLRFRKPIVEKALNKKCYPYVSLQYKSGKGSKTYKAYIHREIAKAFLPNPDNKPCINHLDNDVWNFSLSNLEWCTQKENMRYASDVTKSYDSQKKCYILKDPYGNLHEVFGIRNFCKENNIDWGNFKHMDRGTNRCRSVKGWTIVKRGHTD